MKILVAFLCLLLFSCAKDGNDVSLYIYKTKADYSEKVSVKMVPDKSKISSAPGPHDVDTSSNWPKKLTDGYLLNGIFGGRNTAFLSVDKIDYYDWPVFPGSDSLFQLILDDDPFVEFYYYRDEHNEFSDNNGLDTIRLNQLIRDGELEKYFERIK